MKHKTYAPTDLAEEGCWFSVDLVDGDGAEVVLSCIEAKSDDPGPFTAEHFNECKRRAYLAAIYESEKLAQTLRLEAANLGFDTSHIEVLNARLESGQGLDAVDRAWRQGYLFNHNGQVHPVPSLTGK
jgi:hypothetical protein